MTSTPPDGRSARSRRPTVVVAIIVVAMVTTGLVVAAVVNRGPGDPVAEAIDVARSEDGYDTGLEAGKTLARVASELNRGIRECDRESEPDRCAALGAASGYVQVAAATVVRCTAPGRTEARTSVLDLLEHLRARRPGDPPPPTPSIPTCRSRPHSSSSTSSGNGTQPSLSSW